MAEFTGSLVKYPARASFVWYLGLIAIGVLLLMAPVCYAPTKPPISATDALFTATSATCVTGLSVRSTPTISRSSARWSYWRSSARRHRHHDRDHLPDLHLRRPREPAAAAAAVESFGNNTSTNLRWLLRNVILMTLLIEGLGFVVLAIRNLFDYPPATALWYALFHSVSAFCNAGFALADDSLVATRAIRWSTSRSWP